MEAVFYCEVSEEKMSFTIEQLAREIIDKHQKVLQNQVSAD
jgi:hypothetical protein